MGRARISACRCKFGADPQLLFSEYTLGTRIIDHINPFDEDLLAHYDYALPPELIAHEPAEPRDHSRLLHARAHGGNSHHRFYDLPNILRADDLLIYNETRVVKARLRGEREGGGRVELLVLSHDAQGVVQALARPAKRMRAGMRLRFADVDVEVLAADRFRFPETCDVATFLSEHGEVPLPPYISAPQHLDTERAYQPIFAKYDGSAAAPTASLHFTQDTLSALDARGIERVPLVLTVGLGTFAPVRSERLSEHRMHEEAYDIPQHTVDAIRRARSQGRRIVAIGTTVLRALEGSALLQDDRIPRAGAGTTDLFVKPGFTFHVVDALLTNFHVPQSTLLVLVSTFAGHARIREVYAEAMHSGYRFFSFGDAMLLERVT